MKEMAKEQASTTERISTNRQYQIDATIVWTIEDERHLAQSHLFQKVYSSWNFQSACWS